MLQLLFSLFLSFAKVGLFGFGGGYAMISLIHHEIVVSHGWISSQEFTEIVAISQMTPGPIGINSATYVGYAALQNAGFTGYGYGILGATVATFALVLPSFLLMLLISRFFLKYRKHPSVESALSGIRPAVVGLLGAAVLLLMNAENFGDFHSDTFAFACSIGIFVVTFVAVKKFKVNPILALCAMAVVGIALF